MSDVTARIQDLIAEEFDVEISEVVPEASFVNGLLAEESLEEVELLMGNLAMTLQEEFGIELPDEDVTEMETVNAMIKYITDRL
jgi:acyl carrier protein